MEHGFRIDGRCFFGGPDKDWGQTGGINAGVMLFAPDAAMHQRALCEVEAPSHPERIAGAGPEQDYLSRFFAPHWTHLTSLSFTTFNCIISTLGWKQLCRIIRACIGATLNLIIPRRSLTFEMDHGCTAPACHRIAMRCQFSSRRFPARSWGASHEEAPCLHSGRLFFGMIAQ
jgi:hypothetical protein